MLQDAARTALRLRRRRSQSCDSLLDISDSSESPFETSTPEGGRPHGSPWRLWPASLPPSTPRPSQLHDSGFPDLSPGPTSPAERATPLPASVLPVLRLAVLLGVLGILLLLPAADRFQGELTGKYKALHFASTRRAAEDGSIKAENISDPSPADAAKDLLVDDPDDPMFRPAILEVQLDLEVDYPDDPEFRATAASRDYPDDPNFRAMSPTASSLDYPDDPEFRAMSPTASSQDDPDDPKFRPRAATTG